MSSNENHLICPFCNEPWTDQMEVDYYLISEGCDTCGYGKEASITVEIVCSKCGRVIYKKETIKGG